MERIQRVARRQPTNIDPVMLGGTSRFGCRPTILRVPQRAGWRQPPVPERRAPDTPESVNVTAPPSTADSRPPLAAVASLGNASLRSSASPRATRRCLTPERLLSPLSRLGVLGDRVRGLAATAAAPTAICCCRSRGQEAEIDTETLVVFRSAKERPFAERKATLYAVIPVIAGSE